MAKKRIRSWRDLPINARHAKKAPDPRGYLARPPIPMPVQSKPRSTYQKHYRPLKRRHDWITRGKKRYETWMTARPKEYPQGSIRQFYGLPYISRPMGVMPGASKAFRDRMIKQLREGGMKYRRKPPRRNYGA